MLSTLFFSFITFLSSITFYLHAYDTPGIVLGAVKRVSAVRESGRTSSKSARLGKKKNLIGNYNIAPSEVETSMSKARAHNSALEGGIKNTYWDVVMSKDKG